MRILIAGGGGREHALLWKLRADAPGASFYATRPNGGMAPHCTPVEVSPTDVVALAGWAAGNGIDLVVVGPETPLAAGLADRLRKVGIPVFGPSAAAARIESSKAFAKDLMAGAGVPTAAYEVHAEPAGARACIESMGAPVVVKASGLAAGKGAVVCGTVEEAVATADSMLAGAFGKAGSRVVIEEFMEGEELSVFCLAHDEQFVSLLASQDHKRVGEGDTGPNTGGMGAYAPVGFVTGALMAAIEDGIVGPVLTALVERGCPFSGLLYAGLMITDRGPRVVEFNCRFGDPETQAVLPLLTSSLLEPVMRIAEGSGPGGRTPAFAEAAAVTTVLAAEGYPGSYSKGAAISIPALPEDVHVFHAGTAMRSGRLVASGGRVLAVTAVRRDFGEARAASRAAAAAIEFEGKRFRRDIGWREAARRDRAAKGETRDIHMIRLEARS